MALCTPPKEQMEADVRAWNVYARQMNQKAVAQGLMTQSELERKLREARHAVV